MTRYIPCDNCGHAVAVPGKADDNRMTEFRIRLRVYDTLGASTDDPICDSAAGYPPDHEGIDTVAGLANVLTECTHHLSELHGQVIQGLGHETLARKERGIRPTLSRTGGRGRITLEYDTMESDSGGRQAPRYRARIDLRRLEKDNSANEL